MLGIGSEVLGGKMTGTVWELEERGLWKACGGTVRVEVLREGRRGPRENVLPWCVLAVAVGLRVVSRPGGKLSYTEFQVCGLY